MFSEVPKKTEDSVTLVKYKWYLLKNIGYDQYRFCRLYNSLQHNFNTVV